MTGPHADQAAKARAAIRAGVLAYFVDQFDIYLPIIVLAPAVGYFQSEHLAAGTSELLSALVFASTLIARPLGAAVFGHFADTAGRKRSTLVAVAGFGVTTLCIAVLPGHSTIGGWSVGLLVALRFVDGFFLGGEYTTAVPLAMEWSPKRRRGLVSGVITGTSPSAYAVIALITLVLLEVLPSAGPDSAYARWGWRIPFVVGALLAGVLFAHYLRAVAEPPTARTVAGARSPFVELLVGRRRGALAQAFLLMSGVWLASNLVTAVLPGLLKTRLGLGSAQITTIMMCESVAVAVSYPLLAMLSQRVGRRRFYIGYGLVMAVVGAGGYAVLLAARPGFPGALALTVLAGLSLLGTFGPIAAYLTERFPAEIRASGYGVGYSLALVVPAFYAFYLNGLAGPFGPVAAPAVLAALAGLLVLLGGWLGPETRDVEMGAPAGPDVRRPEGQHAR